MNFTESFQEFSSKVGPMDLALYAGIGIIVWVLFKDRLSPVQQIVQDLFDKVKKNIPATEQTQPALNNVSNDDGKVFFDLIVSWKQTRDLAVRSGCHKAVEVADQMFPYLSPDICGEKEQDNDE